MILSQLLRSLGSLRGPWRVPWVQGAKVQNPSCALDSSHQPLEGKAGQLLLWNWVFASKTDSAPVSASSISLRVAASTSPHDSLVIIEKPWEMAPVGGANGTQKPWFWEWGDAPNPLSFMGQTVSKIQICSSIREKLQKQIMSPSSNTKCQSRVPDPWRIRTVKAPECSCV